MWLTAVATFAIGGVHVCVWNSTIIFCISARASVFSHSDAEASLCFWIHSLYLDAESMAASRRQRFCHQSHHHSRAHPITQSACLLFAILHTPSTPSLDCRYAVLSAFLFLPRALCCYCAVNVAFIAACYDYYCWNYCVLRTNVAWCLWTGCALWLFTFENRFLVVFGISAEPAFNAPRTFLLFKVFSLQHIFMGVFRWSFLVFYCFCFSLSVYCETDTSHSWATAMCAYFCSQKIEREKTQKYNAISLRRSSARKIKYFVTMCTFMCERISQMDGVQRSLLPSDDSRTEHFMWNVSHRLLQHYFVSFLHFNFHLFVTLDSHAHDIV